MTVRLRFAPSPTGHLHIGGARTALFNYLYAKHHGGTFLLRIEDTDLGRHVDEAAQEFADSLRWLGIEWDEGAFAGGSYGPYYCTERLDLYQEYVKKLQDAGFVYECYCSEEELQQEREHALTHGEMPHYSGKCRNLAETDREHYRQEGRKPVLRFKVPADRTIAFQDLIRGPMSFESSGVGGDFVIVKSNGIPTYNFACTVDDHLMEITHVIRGEEHISNTPRQILIYEAFGWNLPAFGHVSLILGPNGKKLSKRDESIIQFIEQYRTAGYLPEALFNFLALLGWSPLGEDEILSRDELIAQFSFDRVSKSGAFFDSAKLDWMNGHYLKEQEPKRLLPMMQDLLKPLAVDHPYVAKESWVLELIALYQDQVANLKQILTEGKTFFQWDAPFEEEARALLVQSDNKPVLTAFLQAVQTASMFAPDVIKTMLHEVQVQTGIKGKNLFMPVRAAATGQLHGRDLPRTLALLGQERVAHRLQSALEFPL